VAGLKSPLIVGRWKQTYEQAMEVNMSKINGSSFFLQWVTAVTVTMTLALMGAFLTMWSIGEWAAQSWGEAFGGLLAGGIFGALLAAGLGFGQAIMVRTQGISFGRWLGQTVLAGMVGMAIGLPLLANVDGVSSIVAGLVIALFVGLPIGLAQWALLKPHLNQAQRWPFISTIAIMAAFAMGLPLGGEGREWVSVGVVTLVTAVITGAGFVWLAREQAMAVAA